MTPYERRIEEATAEALQNMRYGMQPGIAICKASKRYQVNGGDISRQMVKRREAKRRTMERALY